MSLTKGASHIGLTVPCIKKSAAFFEAVGFKEVGGANDYPAVFLSDGNVIVDLWAAKVDEPVPFDRRANIGLHHLAIQVPCIDNLNKVYEIVKGMDDVEIEFSPQRLPDLPMTIFMCYEPGGCRIEFSYHHEE